MNIKQMNIRNPFLAMGSLELLPSFQTEVSS